MRRFCNAYHPVYNADGNFFTQGGWSNAVALAKESETATFKTREMNGNFRLIANIIDGLTLTAQAGVNYKNKNNEDIAKAIPLYTWDNNITYYTGAGSPEPVCRGSHDRRDRLPKLHGLLELR